ncbi:hypothetical protein NMY22_g8753 [Coprinellus aureogranulatus]|nr:hypothetical protein NMY22_g8753 [Coprinellus aureogranulatus]
MRVQDALYRHSSKPTISRTSVVPFSPKRSAAQHPSCCHFNAGRGETPRRAAPVNTPPVVTVAVSFPTRHAILWAVTQIFGRRSKKKEDAQAASFDQLAANAGYHIFQNNSEYRSGAAHCNPVGEGSLVEFHGQSANARAREQWVPTQECLNDLIHKYINTPELANRFLNDIVYPKFATGNGQAAPTPAIQNYGPVSSDRDAMARAAESRRASASRANKHLPEPPMDYSQSYSQPAYHVKDPARGWTR